MRNGIWDIGVRIPVGYVFGLEKFLGLWTGGEVGVPQVGHNYTIIWRFEYSLKPIAFSWVIHSLDQWVE
jgi:hypothetical protein